MLAGITEYWRAYRQYAGVLHFVYLTGSDPESYTSDHFHDVERLDLNPEFMDYMSNAFAPMGVYLNFWKPSLTAGSTQSVQVMMVNDQPRPAEGSLTIALEAVNGELLGEKTTKFSLAPLGQQTYYIDFSVPQTTGKFLLKAIANETGGRSGGSTTSRRRVNILAAKRDTD